MSDRACVDCGSQELDPRSDDPSRSRSRCRACRSAYLKLWRKNNWRRAKARNVWKNMVARCHDPDQGKGCPPSVPRYADYGARGIKACRRWRHPKDGFKNFLADVGLPPTKDSTLDRIRCSRGYSPSNCRWVDPETQAMNRCNTRWVTAIDPATGNEERRGVGAWARVTGIKRDTIRARLNRGWDPDEAVSLPPGGRAERNREAQHDPEVPF